MIIGKAMIRTSSTASTNGRAISRMMIIWMISAIKVVAKMIRYLRLLERTRLYINPPIKPSTIVETAHAKPVKPLMSMA
jgi:hypothetical protein